MGGGGVGRGGRQITDWRGRWFDCEGKGRGDAEGNLVGSGGGGSC